MSVIDETKVELPNDEPGPEERQKRRRRVSVSPAVLVVLVLLVPALWAAFIGLQRLAEPEAFAKYAGTGVVGFTKAKEPGTRITFGITDRLGPLPDVTVNSAQVELSDGSIATATSVSICEREPTLPEDIMGIGVAEGDLSEFCSAVLPIAGQDLGDLPSDARLMITVVPLEAGPVHVTGVEFDYEQDGRSATEHVGYDFRVGLPS